MHNLFNGVVAGQECLGILSLPHKRGVLKPHSSQQALYGNSYTAPGLLASCPGKSAGLIVLTP